MSEWERRRCGDERGVGQAVAAIMHTRGGGARVVAEVGGAVPRVARLGVRCAFKQLVARACRGRASGARAAGISAGGWQTRGAGKACAGLGEVCALEGPPLGAPWGGGNGERIAAFTLEDAFAPKNGFTLDPQIWVKPTSKFLPSEFSACSAVQSLWLHNEFSLQDLAISSPAT